MATGPKNAESSAAEEIARIAKDSWSGADRRASHLVNLSMATLKYLMLNAESDDLKLEAARTLLELPPVRRKLQHQQEAVRPSTVDRRTPIGRRLRNLLDSDPDKAQRLLDLIENEAEKSPEIPASAA